MLLDHVAWLVQGGDCKWCKTGDCWTHPGGKGKEEAEIAAEAQEEGSLI